MVLNCITLPKALAIPTLATIATNGMTTIPYPNSPIMAEISVPLVPLVASIGFSGTEKLGNPDGTLAAFFGQSMNFVILKVGLVYVHVKEKGFSW